MKFTAARLRWPLVAAAVLLLVYGIMGFFVVPMFVRSQLEERGSAALRRPVTVERVRVNPFTCTLVVEGLRVADRDGGELATTGRLEVNFDPLTSLVRREWYFSVVRSRHARKRIEVDAAGVLNVADLFPAGEAAAPGDAVLPRVGVGRLEVEDWAVEFNDRSRGAPFHTVVGPMSFGVRDFTTRPDGSSQYSFSGVTEKGERFAWSGTISAHAAGSKGRVEFTEFSLPKYAPYLEWAFAGRLVAGTGAFASGYEVTWGQRTVARLSDARFSLAGVRVALPDGEEPAIDLRRLEVVVVAADALERTATVSEVTVDGLDVRATRLKDGSLDLARLLRPAGESPEAAAPTADAGAAPSVQVGKLFVSDVRVVFVDESTDRPGRLVLDQVAATLTGVGTDLDRETGVVVTGRIQEAGTFSAAGTARALPFAVDLVVEGAGLPLAAVDPWVGRFAEVGIAGGEARFAGKVNAAHKLKDGWEAAWSGEAGVDGLDIRDGAGGELLGWKSLALRGTTFALEPLAFEAREVALVDPVVALALDAEGNLNFNTALRRVPAAAAVADDAAAGPTRTRSEIVAAATGRRLPFSARVDAVVVSGGRMRLKDGSFEPGFAAEVRDFGGSIRGLSSESIARADVDLAGALEGRAPLRIVGQINPLADDVFSDLTVSFGNIELPWFSAYAGRFLGQRIQEGTLNLDLKYRVSKRFVEGENSLVFERFYLGEKVESAEAVSLPVGLALKLMRDRDGRIVLDPPVRGSLDDPEFSYARIIWRTVGNLVVKAALSPFSFLGSLVPGGDSVDLSAAGFAPGAVELTPETVRKIEVLGQALEKRPEVRLRLVPVAVEADRAGLREERFAGWLEAEARGLAAAGPSSVAEAITRELTAGEQAAVLARVYAARFPDVGVTGVGTDAAASGGNRIREAEGGEAPGWWRRLWRRVFGGGGAGRGGEGTRSSSALGVAGNAESADAAVALEAQRARLLELVPLEDGDLRALGAARVAAVRERLKAGGAVAPERVVVETGTPELGGSGAGGAGGPGEGGRVLFQLE